MGPRLSRFTPLFLLLLAGCARSSMDDQVKISGKVLYRERPLPGGVVTFMSDKGYSGTATIDTNGNYEVMAPVGSLKIKVENRMLKKTSAPPKDRMLKPPAGAGPLQPIQGAYVPIPEKYYSLETSELTCDTTNLSNPFDIRLK